MSIEGMPQLQRRLDAVAKAPAGIPKEWAIRAVAKAKQRVARKTGTTGRSIRVIRVTEDEATVTVGGAGPYLERGTRPHVIVPRRRRALAWATSGAGRRLSGRARVGARRGAFGGMRFARRVNHPGTKAQPFFFDSAREALSEVGVGRIIEEWNRVA